MRRGDAPVIIGVGSTATAAWRNGVLGVWVWGAVVGVIMRGATWGRGSQGSSPFFFFPGPATSPGVSGVISGCGTGVPQLRLWRRARRVTSRRTTVIIFVTRGISPIITSNLSTTRVIVIKLTITHAPRSHRLVMWGAPVILPVIITATIDLRGDVVSLKLASTSSTSWGVICFSSASLWSCFLQWRKREPEQLCTPLLHQDKHGTYTPVIQQMYVEW